MHTRFIQAIVTRCLLHTPARTTRNCRKVMSIIIQELTPETSLISYGATNSQFQIRHSVDICIIDVIRINRFKIE